MLSGLESAPWNAPPPFQRWINSCGLATCDGSESAVVDLALEEQISRNPKVPGTQLKKRSSQASVSVFQLSDVRRYDSFGILK